MDSNLQFWITTFAIVVGPLAAVLITGYLDRRRALKERKLQIFRSLMKTRRAWGSPEHVEALNLIEIDFHGVEKVQNAHKALFGYFTNDLSKRLDENEQQYLARKSEHHATLLTMLLKAMADNLGYRKDTMELLRGGYSPILHGEIETDQTKIRKLLAGLHDGTMVLPTAVVDYRHASKVLEQARETQLLLQHADKLEADNSKSEAEAE